MGCHRGMLAGLVLCCLRLHAALAEEQIFGPSRDNTLYQDVNGALSNGAGDTVFVGRTSAGSIRRALIVFDLAPIPRGAVVQDAKLSLTLTNTANPNSLTVGLHRVLQRWGEAASNATTQGGGGAPAQPGDATWLHTFFDQQFWVNPGGDFAPNASGSLPVGGEGVYVWSTETMAGDVQFWVNNPSGNAGWLLMADEASAVTAKAFGSRENPVPTSRPLLTVTYQLPEAGLIELSSDVYPVDEKSRAARVQIARVGGTSGKVSVSVISADETALAGEDYSSFDGPVTFEDGESAEKVLELEVLDDDTYEGEETFVVRLSGPTGGAQLGQRSTARVSISDDDDLAHTLHFAQFGNGEGFFSQLVLLNRDDSTRAFARISARTDEGQPFQASLNGTPLQEGQLDALIPAQGLDAFQTDGQGPVVAGSVSVRSDRPLSGVIVFGGPFGLAGVGASEATAIRLLGPLETNLASGIDTGIAVQNLENEEIDLSFTLRNSAGVTLSLSGVAGVPALGHLARFVTDLNWDPPVDFSQVDAILAVESAGRIAGTLIQTRPGQFATLPVIALNTLSLEPHKDNTLHQSAEGSLSNGSGDGIFAGRSGPGEEGGSGPLRRGLLAFDLSAVPKGSRIQGVQLTLNLSRAKDGEARDVTVHRLLKDWGEGRSSSQGGFGAPAFPGEATWLHTLFDTGFWDSPGGDFVQNPTAVQTVGGHTQLGSYDWSSPAMTSDVQAWVDQTAENFGWLLKGEESKEYTARRFDSREIAQELNRPKLTMLYELPRPEELHFAQFGNGRGFFSQIVLLNEDETGEALVSIVARKDSGEPFEVSLNGEVLAGGRLDTTIPKGGMKVFKTDGEGSVESGSVTVLSETRVSGVIVFGGDFGLAGVAPSGMYARGFFGPVETDLNARIDTGIAVQNLAEEASDLEITLLGTDGTIVAASALSIQPKGHRALLLTELVWDPPVDFSRLRGTVRVVGSSAVSATMIQTRPGQFATLPVSELKGAVD